MRKVEFLDTAGKLVNEKVSRSWFCLPYGANVIHRQDYKREYDPTIFKSTKTGRGPLTKDWHKTHVPVMCCYKVVTIQVKRWGMVRGRIEKYLMRVSTGFVLLA